MNRSSEVGLLYNLSVDFRRILENLTFFFRHAINAPEAGRMLNSGKTS